MYPLFFTAVVFSTTHFDLRYDPDETTAAEVEIVAKKAEDFFDLLSAYLGRGPGRRITISLEGDRINEPGRRWAYVDTDAGWMHLYRFKGDAYPYQAGLSHELVHAYRFLHLQKIGLPPKPAFLFLEEGLAEFLSNRIEPKKESFVSYGYELRLVAGQWLWAGQAIPLAKLLADQGQLRAKCFTQAYSQQAAFFEFIDRELGSSVLKRLAYATDVNSPEDLGRYFGSPFPDLARRWEFETLSYFKEQPAYEAIGPAWRAKVPHEDLRICLDGIDY